MVDYKPLPFLQNLEIWEEIHKIKEGMIGIPEMQFGDKTLSINPGALASVHAQRLENFKKESLESLVKDLREVGASEDAIEKARNNLEELINKNSSHKGA